MRIRAPLSALPVIPHGQRQIHAGRFYAERIFDPPVDATGCHFVSFHVHATADVPVTIYINDVHSDVDLHAGEQIVRIDMRQFDVKGRFSYAEWDHRLHRISLDVWPQDNYYPYPPAKDTEITLFGMTASNQDPEIEKLPHRGQAIWLSQFRPNLPRGVAVQRSLYDQYLQRQRYKHVGLDYGSRWISERFRTFTEHRIVSPMFTIVVSNPATPAEQLAAERLQDHLEKMFGVRLPVRSADTGAADWAENAILLGRQACVTAGRITDDELRDVGPGGFAINAYQGRIAIAGTDDAGTRAGVLRYVEDHGAQVLRTAADLVAGPPHQFRSRVVPARLAAFPRRVSRTRALPGRTRGSDSSRRFPAGPVPNSLRHRRHRETRGGHQGPRAGSRQHPAAVSAAGRPTFASFPLRRPPARLGPHGGHEPPGPRVPERAGSVVEPDSVRPRQVKARRPCTQSVAEGIRTRRPGICCMRSANAWKTRWPWYTA